MSRKECDYYHKGTNRNNNTYLAQGGIAAAVATYDNPNDHFEDTLVAGCHYNNEDAVRYLVEEGPKEMNHLIESGMKFDGDETGPHLEKKVHIENAAFYMQVAMRQERIY